MMNYLQHPVYAEAHDMDEDIDTGDITDEMVEAARVFLELVVAKNYDWTGPHMARTPVRFAKMIREMTTEEPFEFTTFPTRGNSDEMVIVRNIDFVSLCAHHVVPFIGTAHVAYIPSDTLVGLSKIARSVQWWAKGLWVQEELTTQIASYLEQNLNKPKGVAVVLEASHQCMTLRGVKAIGTDTITSCMRGVFLDNDRHARQEFLSLIGRHLNA